MTEQNKVELSNEELGQISAGLSDAEIKELVEAAREATSDLIDAPCLHAEPRTL